MKLSFVIITFNEEKNIRACLESIGSLASEIIIVDSYSSDRTIDIAKEFKAIIIQRKFDGYITQKNFANEQANGEYIFSLDADEKLSPELLTWLKDEKNFSNFDVISFNRKNWYCGKWMNFGGWYPDRKVRMWKNGKARWAGTMPHEQVLVNDGIKIHHLSVDILHHAYETVSQHIQKSMHYAQVAAYQYEKYSYWKLFGKLFFSGIFRFFRNVIFKLGILDGWRGIVSAFITTIEINYKYWLALEKKINS